MQSECVINVIQDLEENDAVIQRNSMLYENEERKILYMIHIIILNRNVIILIIQTINIIDEDELLCAIDGSDQNDLLISVMMCENVQNDVSYIW